MLEIGLSTLTQDFKVYNHYMGMIIVLAEDVKIVKDFTTSGLSKYPQPNLSKGFGLLKILNFGS